MPSSSKSYGQKGLESEVEGDWGLDFMRFCLNQLFILDENELRYWAFWIGHIQDPIDHDSAHLGDLFEGEAYSIPS